MIRALGRAGRCRAVWGIVVVLAGGCARGQGLGSTVPLPRPAFQVHDLMPGFWTYWEEDRPRARGDTLEEMRLFRQRVIAPDSAFFARAAQGPTDAHVRRFLAAVPRDIDAMRDLSRRLSQDLDRFTGAFLDTFPDFSFNGHVFFYPSLYVRDGGTMSFPPSVALMFGVDMIARIHGTQADLGVLFFHELFHLYHGQYRERVPRPHPLYYGIWSEGLATYVSQRMRPGATVLQALLNDRALEQAMPRLPELAREALAHLDDTSTVYARPWFQAGAQADSIPARAAYLVGLLAARALGADRSLPALARLSEADVRRGMERTLRSLATGAGGEGPYPSIR